MNANGWRMADSDMHIMEPPDLWQRYIDPAWLSEAPIGLSEVRRDMRVQVKDTVLSISSRQRVPRGWTGGVGWRPTQDTSYAHAEDRGWDATSQLEAMDAEGLDAAVLFPSRGLFVLGLDTVEQAGDAPGYEPGLAAAVAARTTTGCTTSVRKTRRGSSAPGSWHRTTSMRRPTRSSASCRTTGSRPCSCTRAV